MVTMETFHPDVEHPRVDGSSTLNDALAQVEAGYPFEVFVRLADQLGISQKTLAHTLHISPSTLGRRRGGTLSPAESSRVYEVTKLLNAAERAVGDPEDARLWLTRHNPNLGAVPIELARTAPGLEAVERYLAAIADGVYL